MLGWLNWALNTYPKLCPGLSGFYVKISGITDPHTPLCINAEITSELSWFASRMRASSGIHIMTLSDWAISDDEDICVTMLTDASVGGLGN